MVVMYEILWQMLIIDIYCSPYVNQQNSDLFIFWNPSTSYGFHSQCTPIYATYVFQ